MAMEIDEAVIRVDNHAEIDEVEPIEISDDEARRVRLYENFYQVNAIDPALYAQHDVKRGLRNADGTGVARRHHRQSPTSTATSSPTARSCRPRARCACAATTSATCWAIRRRRRAASTYEEVAYLLLMGELPTQEQLDRFIAAIDSQRELPDGFTASMIMRDTPPDIMNVLARSILLLYAYDEHAEDRSVQHEISTAISLISRLPRIMVLAYYAMRARYTTSP